MEVMMCVVCSVLAMCGRLRAVHLQAKSQRIQLDLTTVFYYYIGITNTREDWELFSVLLLTVLPAQYS